MFRHKPLSILAVSETWLKGRTGNRGSTNRSIGVNRYRIIRNDRMTATMLVEVWRSMYLCSSIKTKIVAKSCGPKF